MEKPPVVMKDIELIQSTLIGFTKRAEKASEESLVATFVDSAPLFTLLSTPNNQVIYGRRGTGKTHALKYLAEHVDKQGGIAIFVDLRTVGSNGAIYADGSRPLAERASTLLADALAGLLLEFYSLASNVIGTHPNPDEVTRRLDALQASISTVKISGDVEQETRSHGHDKAGAELKINAQMGSTPSVGVDGKFTRDRITQDETRSKRIGRETIHLTFGSIAGAIEDMMTIVGGRRLWLLIDEWSEIPVDLQPYLADLFRRTVFPVNSITVKIAAIEHRSNFAILKEKGEYVGLELGADVSADLNLDDFLVFDNDQRKSVDFISDLVYRHYVSAPGAKIIFTGPDQLISTLFTQRPVFDEFVRAVEGVPRDALNLIAKIATKSYGQQISMSHVRVGSKDWYNQDKAAVIRNSPDLADLLQHIISEVIGTRRTRAFLLSSKTRFSGVERLFDARLLHILKKNVSSNDAPGVRYDVFKIDYGCYVDLIGTTRAPEGLLQEDDGAYTDVPKDDYRSIRRAILDPSMLPAGFDLASG